MNFASAIVRFEYARRVLGHDAVVNIELIEPMFHDDDTRTGLIRYATALVESQEDSAVPGMAVPVIPRVDITSQEVTHTTCTGRTTLTIAGGVLAIEREERLTTDARDIALWLLADTVTVDCDGEVETDGLDLRENSLSVFNLNHRSRDFKRTIPARIGASKHLGEWFTAYNRVELLEAMALLISVGMPLDVCCRRAAAHGIVADSDKVREEIAVRQFGLILNGRWHCYRAHRVLSGINTAMVGRGEDLPEWVSKALEAIRSSLTMNYDQRPFGHATTADAAAEVLADWEIELRDQQQ